MRQSTSIFGRYSFFQLYARAWGLILMLGLIAAPLCQAQPAPQRLIAHEWGVITALADEQGQLLTWQPLEGAPPVPSFIQRYEMPQSPGTVRIDIPAIFFKVDQQTAVTMNMEFLKGYFYTGYPRADYQDYTLSWPAITLLPGGNMTLITEPTASRYYQLRNTQGAQVRVDHAGHKQYERFIHLRGAGRLELPLRVKVDHEEFHIEPASNLASQIGQVIAIENRKGKISFRMVDLQEGKARFARSQTAMNIDLATARLRRLLNQQGLYPDEASAAVAGISPEWFEPGTRLIYLLPRQMVDETFKCQLTPAPSNHLRLYAVRVELITPQLRQDLLDRLTMVNLESPTSCEALLGSATLIRPLLRHLNQDLADEVIRIKIASLLKD
jgi:hypothetical protein